MPSKERNLFLASHSPRRFELLNEAKIPFTPINNCLKIEHLDPNLPIKNAVQKLSEEKAKISALKNKGLILSADTVVYLNSEIFEKPKTINDARNHLLKLSNKTHQVITAFCLYDTISNITISKYDSCDVTFKKLTLEEINAYITNFKVLDKAGAYAIQDIEKPFITKITGDKSTVIGLPIKLLIDTLNQENYRII